MYPPHSREMSLKQEGLGRYVGSLLKAFTGSGHSVTIACPRWSANMLYELLEDFGMEKSQVEFLLPKATSQLLEFYYKRRYRKRKTKSNRFKTATVNLLTKLIIVLLLLKSKLIFLLLIVGALLSLIIMIPVCIILFPIWCIGTVILKLAKHVSLRENIKSFLNLQSVWQLFKDYIVKTFPISTIQEIMRMDSAEQIMRQAKGMKEPVDIWYSPMAFWPEFNKMPGVRVLCAPDLVTTEFPLGFVFGGVSRSTERVRETLTKGQYFITYCEYLKSHLLIEQLGKRPDSAIAIPHAANTENDYLEFESRYLLTKEDIEYEFAKYIVHDMCCVHPSFYIRGYDNGGEFSVDNVQYIFYASQLRPSKNMLTLIRAYEYILREKNVKVKLFLTCALESLPNVHEYVYGHRLQYDVITFRDCTNQQLAALYKCAKLVVNPTLFEGGFPFTFGEGMSVGTPSVMSAIPQVLEVMGEETESEKYLFDPCNYKDMASKIIYGLDHGEEIYKLQKKVFDKMMKRTWKEVGEEYVQAFQYFIKRSQEEEEKNGYRSVV